MNRFKELREERGYSIRGLENQTGINHNSINRYENETRDPSTQTLKQLADFFEVSIDYMLNHSSCYIYAGYEMKSFTFKIRENYYKELKEKGFIYFKDDKRYIDLNGLLGINGDALGIVLEFARIGRIDALFNKKRFPSDKEIKELDDDLDVVLTSELIDNIKNAISE